MAVYKETGTNTWRVIYRYTDWTGERKQSILLQFIEKTNELKTMLDRANNQIRDLTGRVNRLEPENERLRGVERDYGRLQRHLGGERTDEIIETVKEQEIAEKQLQQQLQQQTRRNRNSYAR